MSLDPNEKVVEDLLYEASARKHLTKKQQAAKNPIIKYLLGAAAAAAVILAFFMLDFPSGNSMEQRMALIEEVHAFPVVAKSRSSQVSIVDNYLVDIQAENYKKVLDKLYGSTLTEKDAFVKAHILFEVGKFNEAQEFLEPYVFKDAYYKEEKQWLLFLIDFQKGNVSEKLIKRLDSLSPDYKLKAQGLLDRHSAEG